MLFVIGSILLHSEINSQDVDQIFIQEGFLPVYIIGVMLIIWLEIGIGMHSMTMC